MIRLAKAPGLFVAVGLALSPALPGATVAIVTSALAAEHAMNWTGTWTRLEIADAAGNLRVLPDPSRLVFEVDSDLRISVSVGCNRIGSQIVPGVGQAVTFAPGMATRMACMGEIGAAEDRFVDAMTKIARFEMRGDDVVFLDADGHDLLLIGR